MAKYFYIHFDQTPGPIQLYFADWFDDMIRIYGITIQHKSMNVKGIVVDYVEYLSGRS